METKNSGPKHPGEHADTSTEYPALNESPAGLLRDVSMKSPIWDSIILPTITGIKLNPHIQGLTNFCKQIMEILILHSSGVWMILSSLLLIFIGIPMLNKVPMWTLKVFVTSLLMISIAFLVFGCHVVYKGMMNNEGCLTRLPSPGEEDQEDKETKADKKDMQALKEEGTKNGDQELSGKGADKEGVKVVMESPIKNGLVGSRVGEAANKEAVKVVAKDAAGNDVEKSGVRKGGCTCNELKVTKVVAKGEMSRHRG